MSPKPVHRSEHGPVPRPLGQLDRWGTQQQKQYFRKRVRRDTIAVLHQVHEARRRVSQDELDSLSPELRHLFEKFQYLHDHVPFLLCGTVTRRSQWAALEAQLPNVNGTQTSLPFATEEDPD